MGEEQAEIELAFVREGTSTDEVMAILREEFPGRGFKKLVMNYDGWENQVGEVDGEWIVRFPKFNAAKITREGALLGALQGKTTAETPKVLLWGKRTACMGYPKLQGLMLSGADMDRLGAQEIDALGEDLARFMMECQAALTAATFDALGVQRGWSRPDIDTIAARLGTLGETRTMDRFLEATKLVCVLEDDAPQAFLHRDLHVGNYVVNEADLRLKGVFDFGDADYGDVHRDFANLATRPQLCLAAASAYGRLSGRKLDPHLLKAQAWLYFLWILSEHVEEPDSFQHQFARRCLATLEAVG